MKVLTSTVNVNASTSLVKEITSDCEKHHEPDFVNVNTFTSQLLCEHTFGTVVLLFRYVKRFSLCFDKSDTNHAYIT